MFGRHFSSIERFKKNHNSHIYPKPLPKLDLRFSIDEDENGLTAIERCALVGAWRLIVPFKRSLGRAVFHEFLVKYEKLFVHFRRHEKLDMALLHSHAKNIMNLVGKLIMELDSPLEMHTLLIQAMPHHENWDVSESFILLLSEKLCEYLYDSFIFEKNKSPTLRKAFQKLFNLIGTFNECERDRKTQITLRYSTLRHSLISLLSKKSTFSMYRQTLGSQGKTGSLSSKKL